jgi:hypothetical protein
MLLKLRNRNTREFSLLYTAVPGTLDLLYSGNFKIVDIGTLRLALDLYPKEKSRSLKLELFMHS